MDPLPPPEFGHHLWMFPNENLQYLGETKKRCAKFFICCKVHENVTKNH